ncbi:MAG: hypothetical protein OEU32_18800 [Acidimicrobiia bacterium]|nr:hypothetical protein [Acidimicrobiia bacterium]
MSDNTAATISVDELADLLMETGQHHHRAYIESDGTDPEWAMWYAGYLQSRLWERAGSLPSRSLLVHLLLGAQEDHEANGGDSPWPLHYARIMLAALAEA